MSHLYFIAKQAESYPDFLASKIAQYQKKYALNDEQLLEKFECTLDDLFHLKLCKIPRMYRYREDVGYIVAFTKVNREAFLDFLKDE